MTRINWDEVNQLRRLDEIIAYCIITLQEAYTAPDNEELGGVEKNDISDWVRWEIAYDEYGRAYFRYAASLYVVDRNPLANVDMLNLINSPTKWLVNHQNLAVATRDGDTSLEIDTLTDIPPLVTTMEKLLFWAIVLGDWWNRTLRYLGATETPDLPPATPIDSWGEIPESPGDTLPTEGEGDSNSIDAQFDEYNGEVDSGGLPDFLQGILERSNDGTGDFNQSIDLPARDAGVYRENLVTCEEQDPAIKNFSQQQLDVLLPTK